MPHRDDEQVIYRMTIRLKDGRIIRRPNGRPFRIVLRSPGRPKPTRH